MRGSGWFAVLAAWLVAAPAAVAGVVSQERLGSLAPGPVAVYDGGAGGDVVTGRMVDPKHVRFTQVAPGMTSADKPFCRWALDGSAIKCNPDPRVGPQPGEPGFGTEPLFAAVRARMGDGNDVFTGSGGPVQAHGGAGDDLLDATGATGASLNGDVGNDRIVGSPGDDTLVESHGYDPTGDDTTTGGAGNDYIHKAGDDWIVDGGTGDDRIFYTTATTGGTVQVDAGSGDDFVFLAQGGTTIGSLSCGPGHDEVRMPPGVTTAPADCEVVVYR